MNRLRAIVWALLLGSLLFEAEQVHAQGQISVAKVIPGPPECAPITGGMDTVIKHDFPHAAIVHHCFSTLSDLAVVAKGVQAGRPSVIVVFGSAPMARAVKDAAPEVPLVFADVPDPIGNGLIASLSHPGGNVTGITSAGDELIAKRLELLREAFPGLERVGVLGNPANTDQKRYQRLATEAAASLGLSVRHYEVSRQGDLAAKFRDMRQDTVQAVMILPDGWFFPFRQEIVGLAATHRLPVMYTNTTYPQLGGLLTYGASLPVMSEIAGAYVVRILQGTKPADLPVERPRVFEFIVNAKSAREQGIRLSPTTMLRATQVIE